MSIDARPWAWMEELKPGSRREVEACLKQAGLLTTADKGGLEVRDMNHPQATFLAVGMADSQEAAAEGFAPEIEQAEQVLRQAGFGLEMVRRQTSQGWLSPYLQVCGKSAEGPGPTTYRRTQQVAEVGVIDFGSSF
jgi:hypothetical protein